MDLTFDPPIPEEVNYGSATPQTSFGLAASNGTSDDVARADHTHGTPDDPTDGLVIPDSPILRAATRADTLDAGTNSVPVIVAHRGGRYAPENTLAAFRAALAAGSKVLEIDICWSADGVPMVIHNTTIQGTVLGFTGNVSDYSFADLRGMDAGTSYNSGFSSFGIPSLYEVLDEFGGRCTMIVEIKANLGAATLAQTADYVADIIADYGLEDFTVLAAFNDLSGSDAWTVHGIPFLRYTSTISSDGTIASATPAAHYAAGYRYVGVQHGAANFATGINAWNAVGAIALAWTINGRADRDADLAAASGLKGIITNDPVHLIKPDSSALSVGLAIACATKSIPAGLVPWYNNGSTKAEIIQSESEGLASGVTVNGQTGLAWTVYGSDDNQRSVVFGRLGWGGGGLGKVTANMVMDDLPADMTRFGGLQVLSNDKGHVSGGGSDTAVGYEGLLRGNGDLVLFRIDSDGSETSLGTATAADLVADTVYPISLEVTATNVIFTANGTSVDVADATHRSLTVCGVIRSRAKVLFASVLRAS